MDFASALLDQGSLTTDSLAHARQVSIASGVRLAPTLLRLGLADEQQIASAFAAAYGFERLPTDAADGIAVVAIPADTNPRFLRRHRAMPLSVTDGEARIALFDPEDEDAVAALRFAVGADIQPILATPTQIEALLGAEDEVDPTADLALAKDTDLERLAEGESDAPIIRLVQTLLANAVQRRASDVHVEPMARQLMIRYRIDGRLVEAERYAARLAAPITSRIKVMAGLDIAESRLPQDGRLRLTVRGRDVDVRVSTSPAAHGESIVLRLLGRSELPLDLDRLGLPEKPLERLLRALDRPHGIILVTGPTGSGKSTTLYAALNRLRRPEVKILTVEDPVEILIEGINQVQVRPEIGLSYAQTLRAFLRQDPDILMIGEIRDSETAEIALRAALTGHLVLSTLHTNSTTGAFTRLTDIGIEAYLAASTVNAVIAQRLIRTLCLECAEARPLGAEEELLFVDTGLAVPSHVREPVGCLVCQSTGYRGRMPLFEMLEIDTDLRSLIREGRVEEQARRMPPSETLLGHGLSLVAQGLTSLAEVHRAVQAE